MLIRTLRKPILAVSMLTLIAHAIPAEAGSRYRRHRVDVDIERLDSEYRYHHGHGELIVSYKVEIENVNPYEPFDLILEMTEHGHPLLDAHDRPVAFTIPLIHPHEIDDDEVEYKDYARFSLPAGLVHYLKRLKLHGTVVRRGSLHPLDHEDDRVKVYRGHTPRVTHYRYQQSSITRHHRVTSCRRVDYVRHSRRPVRSFSFRAGFHVTR